MIMPKLFKTVLFAVFTALSVSDASAAQNKAFFKNLPNLLPINTPTNDKVKVIFEEIVGKDNVKLD